MKEMNGIEAAEKIREFAPETIIIFISSHSSYIFDAFRIEALHFLVKPIKDKKTLFFHSIVKERIYMRPAGYFVIAVAFSINTKGFEHISSFACFLGDDYEDLYGEVDIKPFGKAFIQDTPRGGGRARHR